MFFGKNTGFPEETERDFTVRQHKIGYGVGIWMIAAGGFILILEILYHVSAIPLWVYGIILAIFALGIFVCMEVKNRQLAVKGTALYYRSTFGRVRQFALEDIGSVKAVSNPSGGRDDLRLYDKKGRMLCRLETGMQNAESMFWYLYDNEIPLEMEKNTKKELTDIIFQMPVDEEKISGMSREVYGQAQAMMEEWVEKNKKLGAGLLYGFAEYHGSLIDPEAQIQPEESRASGKTDDYLCVLEVFVKKENYFIRDRRQRLLLMDFPVFYKRKSRKITGEVRLYYNENWKKEVRETLSYLAKYLQGHKFIMDDMELDYELKKEV
ncbi:MAG: hypothetical protein K2P19_07105 [Kineothrix sp.]|nr:hypothetical protein [Kineothrix sp.]NBI90218.1 hypothetical protein [Lachnospiraceae bacterium]